MLINKFGNPSQHQTKIYCKTRLIPKTHNRSVVSQAGAYNQQRITPQDLNNPIHAWADVTKTVKVPDQGGKTGLTAYMRLPPEQYDLLDASMISYHGKNKFSLNVPRLEVFTVWIQPRVDVEVNVTREQVQVIAYDCHLEGPPPILGINRRFCYKLTLDITHVPSSGTAYNGNGNGNGDNNSITSSSRNDGEMTGNLRLDVWAENIPPLMLVPPEIIQTSVNLILDRCVDTTLAIFMYRLGQDFEKWQSTPTYRKAREQKAMEMMA